ncbi:MAG: P-loop NTPase, partial [Oscillospiraceae bacterium]
PLTVYQSLPVDGIIIVASPQELVSMIVEKAVKMANMMNVPILGLVENMSYVQCPDCNKKLYVFGQGKVQETADKYGLPLLAQIPIDQSLSKNCDQGVIELFEGDYLDSAFETLEKLL